MVPQNDDCQNGQIQVQLDTTEVIKWVNLNDVQKLPEGKVEWTYSAIVLLLRTQCCHHLNNDLTASVVLTLLVAPL